MTRVIRSPLVASFLACAAGACAVDAGPPSGDATGAHDLALAAGDAPVTSDDPTACAADADCAMIPVGCEPGAACPGIGWIALNRPAAAAYGEAHRCVAAPAPFCPISLLVWPFVARCDGKARRCELALPRDDRSGE